MERDFLEKLKCPVCLKIPENEIFQCIKGHSFCAKCSEEITQCSECSAELGTNKIRSLPVENLLDMMKFNCPYNSLGCEQNKLSRKDLSPHFENCVFGGPSIPFCEYLGYACNYRIKSTKTKEDIQHLCDKHQFCLIKTSSYVYLRLDDFKTPDRRVKSLWTPIILKAFDTYFIFVTQSDEQNLSLLCFLLASQSSQTFPVNFSILPTSSPKEPALNWTTNSIPISQAETLLQFRPFLLPLDLLHKSYLDRRALLVKVMIHINNPFDMMMFGDDDNIEVVDICRAVKFPISNSLYPIRNNTHIAKYRGKDVEFRDVGCDVCRQKPITGIEYKCLECEDYDLCFSCMENQEHSFHHFAIIRNDEQNVELRTKIRQKPYVETLKITLETSLNQPSPQIQTIHETLRCQQNCCANKPDFICLQCRGPYSLCSAHFFKDSQHPHSHYFAVCKSEKSRKFALSLLQCEKMLG